MREVLAFKIGKGKQVVTERQFSVLSTSGVLGFEHNLSREYGFLIFMIICDPEGNVRFQKQLGCSENIISIGKNEKDTTIGGVPGKIFCGEWKIRICLFAEYAEEMIKEDIDFNIVVSDCELPVTESIGGTVWVGDTVAYDRYDFKRKYDENHRWYKGDLHAHTRLSDGVELLPEVDRKMKIMKLDYYIPTEHNVLHTGWCDTDKMIVPGVEITTTLGHANLFGIDKRPEATDDIICNKDPKRLSLEINNIIRECKERKWLFSVNHPFLYIWQWNMDELRLSDMDCLEIINDPTYEAVEKACACEANKKAVMMSDVLWADGYRICAIGGSDSHKRIDDFYEGAKEPSIPGDPATWLYMEGMSPENLLGAIRNCNCFVTRHCEVDFTIEAVERNGARKKVIFGDVLSRDTVELNYEIIISKQKQIPEIFYMYNGEKRVVEVQPCEMGRYRVVGNIMMGGEPYIWIRFGAQKENEDFLFYGNPLTRGNKTNEFKNFGEVKGYVNELWERKVEIRD